MDFLRFTIDLLTMPSRVLKIFLWILLIAVLAFLVLIVASPYKKQPGFSYRLVQHTVRIQAPAEQVYAFLGKSANARRWSVFVNHINPLNAAEVPDGKVGSRRRCFKNADETGTQWDELITVVEPVRRRQLLCYDLKEFALTADGLATEQLYKPLGPDACELTFTLFFKDGHPSLAERLKIRLAAYYVKDIYRKNMENIRRINEAERVQTVKAERIKRYQSFKADG